MDIAEAAAQIRALWRSPRLPGDLATEWLTPDRTAYAVAWIIASLVVDHRYSAAALDAIPLYAPAAGWDRFVLTRRLSCDLCAAEPANAFGQLQLGSGGAVALTDPAGAIQVALAPDQADRLPAQLEQLLQSLPAPALGAGDHRACRHARAPHYPSVFAAMAGLAAAEPSLVVAREIFIDADVIDGMHHPLWAQTARPEPGLTYDWFGLRHAAMGTAAFVRINGQQAIYRTERSTWASHFTATASVTPARLRGQLRSWLGLTAQSG